MQSTSRVEKPTQRNKKANVAGWGADLEPASRPAYPKERTPPRFIDPHWEEPEQQPVNIKVFQSIERDRISRVFGTSCPPKGLSGLIRMGAYKLSEGDIRHWLLLLFADRVNEFEGIVEDIFTGKFPHLLREMGIKSELKYNGGRRIMVRLVVLAVLAAGGVIVTRNAGLRLKRA